MSACPGEGCDHSSHPELGDLVDAQLKNERDEREGITPSVTLIPVAQEFKPDGLQLIFQTGEMLPFKSIWFEVENVAKDYLVLRPRTTTSAFQKAKARGQKT